MTLPTAAATFLADTDKAHQIVHGDKNTVVQTDGGPVRSLAKLVSDSQDAINTAAVVKAQLVAASGASSVGYGQRTVANKLDDVVSVKDFGAVPNTGADMGPQIALAHAAAQALSATLVFPAGEYCIGVGTSFILDPQKARWINSGVVSLRWLAAPTAGYAVQITAGELAPYATGQKMAGMALGGISLIGGPSSGARFAATGLRIGNGTNQTYGIRISDVALQGWTTNVEFMSNVWSIRFDNLRALWGDIVTPASPVNFGENMEFSQPFFADGCNLYLHGGEFTMHGGSLDNGSAVLDGPAMLKWFGPHFENPGTTTIAAPFVSLTHQSASAFLYGLELVINSSGVTGSITTAPFNVDAAVTIGGLFVDGMQFTQRPAYGFDNLVSGTGRCAIRRVVPLALSNFYFQPMAANHPGALRNGDFEANSLAGWTTATSGAGLTGGASGIAASSARKRAGTYSVLLTAQGGTGAVYLTLTQKAPCQPGDYVPVSLYYNADLTGLNVGETGVLDVKLQFLDDTGAVISQSTVGTFISLAAGTDQGATFTRLRGGGIAPIGTRQAQISIQAQRQGTNPTGAAKFYIDDVVLNVCGS